MLTDHLPSLSDLPGMPTLDSISHTGCNFKTPLELSGSRLTRLVSLICFLEFLAHVTPFASFSLVYKMMSVKVSI
jgi:hypothetical protein